MVEAIVGVLIGKFGAALANEAVTFSSSLFMKEVHALKGLLYEINDVKEELESIQAYLHDAERFNDTDVNTNIFIKNICCLAFQIEDVVDEFTYKLEDKHGGFATRFKNRVCHVKTWRHLVQKLQDIKAKIHAAEQRKNHYAVTGMDLSFRCSDHQENFADSSLHFRKDDDLVGIKENKEMLIQWLTGDFQERMKITASGGWVVWVKQLWFLMSTTL
ncbi:disease resistance protein RPM1-like [Oryza brachyantha]|uniref:Disease resistance N-terminal domain-containing protein n=1 Tax=Oryza brachyantha TaxID=4533 RepID=J3N152_ORYBR|nr:disease resistance protein RPM1-like [Oryza brachyantha]